MLRKVVMFLTLVLIVLGVVGVIMANGEININWNVLAEGGGQVSAGIFVLDNTIGQATIGQVSTENTSLCTGYWCLEGMFRRLYMPVVIRFEE